MRWRSARRRGQCVFLQLDNVRVIPAQGLSMLATYPGHDAHDRHLPQGRVFACVRFNANHRDWVSAADTYLEYNSFYHVVLEIDPDLSATARYHQSGRRH
jgi:hypothetical protein